MLFRSGLQSPHNLSAVKLPICTYVYFVILKPHKMSVARDLTRRGELPEGWSVAKKFPGSERPKGLRFETRDRLAGDDVTNLNKPLSSLS